MGGHHSAVASDVATNIAASVIVEVAASNISVADGSNVIVVSGSGDTLVGVDQTLSVSLTNPTTVTDDLADVNSTTIGTEISQALGDSEQALTEFLDPSGDSVRAGVTTSITNTVTSSTVADCLSSISGVNTLVVSGDDDTLNDVKQQAVLSVIAGCTAAGSTSSSNAANVTNSVNQHSAYNSESPLAFIGDAIDSAVESAAGMAAVAVVLVVCFILLGRLLSRHHRHHREGGALPAAAAPLQASAVA